MGIYGVSTPEVLDNHKSVLISFGIQTNNEELDLPYIYWIPKMHKNPYKHRVTAGSSKCSTKPLSILFTNCLHILSNVSRITAWQPSQELDQSDVDPQRLDHLKSPNFNLITNIKSFDFSTLYRTIPHQKLKSSLAYIIRNSFIHKNGNRRCKYQILGRKGPYYMPSRLFLEPHHQDVREHSDSKSIYTEEDTIRMLKILVDNVLVVFTEKVFH